MTMESAVAPTEIISAECSVCREFHTSKYERPRKDIQVKWGELQQSCPNCLLRGVLRRFGETEGTMQMSKHGGLTLYGQRFSGTVAIYSTSPTPWPWIPVSEHLGLTSSDESINWAKNKIDWCLENHENCQTHRKPRSRGVPRRLLYLGSTLTVTLREMKESNVEYVCLSHRWGKCHTLVTTRWNLEEHFRGIRWWTLPRTYQDAVDFTRRLGIQYLWIDSLCIIQDDEDDWRKEAAVMGQIYENCIVCLAASASKDDQSGCFSGVSLPIQEFTPEEVPIPCNGTSEKSSPSWKVYAQRGPGHTSMTDNHQLFHSYANEAAEDSLLLSRGWVFQERFLAPRYLHFAKHELSLECGQDFTCQCGGVRNQVQFPPSKSQITAVLASKDQEQLVKGWRLMVTKYSTLTLTYPTDRFPAIAGLTSRFQSSRGSRCIAGIWEDTALEDLGWDICDQGAKIAPARIRAKKALPSWSWASVSGVVGYTSFACGVDGFQPLSKIISFGHPSILENENDTTGEARRSCVIWATIDNTKPLSEPHTPLESISAAVMSISGVLMPVQLSYERRAGDIDCHIYHRTLERPQSFSNDFPLGLPGQDFIPSGATIHCFQLFKNNMYFVSLVLRCLDTNAALYERVGLFRQRVKRVEEGETKNLFEGMTGSTVVRII